MFPPTHITTGTPRRTWREAVRRAADLAVAFVTLESYELPGARGAAAGPAPHPHREPLRAPARRRRPGAAAPRAQHCVAPATARPRRATTQHSLR